MSDRGDELREATRRAAERAARERREAAGGGGAPRPGDLYVVPATAAYDIEWLVVCEQGEAGWLVLPADGALLATPGEVEVTADDPGGPLTLHARFPVVVPERLLAAARRAGRVGEERRAAAERRWRHLGDGTVAAEPVHDPDDRQRLGELAAAQRALQAAASGERPASGGEGESGGGTSGGAVAPFAAPARLRPAKSRFAPPPWMSALAAVLALAVVGLAGWGLALQAQVEALSGARPIVLGPSIAVGVRGAEDLVVPRAEGPSALVALSIEWTEPVEASERFRLIFFSPQGEELDGIEVVPTAHGVAGVAVPENVLRRARVLRLERVVPGGPNEIVLEQTIDLEDD
jgi:hypothetical protein